MDEKYYKLKTWLKNSIEDINRSGLTQDIHIDQFFSGDFRNLDKKDVFERCCSLFNYFVKHIVEASVDVSEINIFLNIDLVSESNKFEGKPDSLQSIVDLIEISSVPEIILYRETNSNEIPLTELYRIPIIDESLNLNPNTCLFYKEHRQYDDWINGNDYTREINLVFMQ